MISDYGLLQSDLKNFGLNPEDWLIEQLEERFFHISHIEDRQFFFLGETQSEKETPEWTHLYIFSL